MFSCVFTCDLQWSSQLMNWNIVFLLSLQEDASNITILGLLLDCSLPKMFYNQPQV